MVGIPELDATFHPLVWCPMMIKLKENSQFVWTGAPLTGDHGNLIVAMNTENFRESLKQAYAGKSMSLPFEISKLKRQKSAPENNEAEDEDGFDCEELKLMEQHMSNGYRITRKDERENLLTLERPDEIKCRGRRPQHDKFRNTTTLHFGGRVKM